MIEDASFEDVVTIQVRRHRLESWADKPFFDRVLRGCMVRCAAFARPAHPTCHALTQNISTPVAQHTSHRFINPNIFPLMRHHLVGNNIVLIQP